MKKRSSIQKIIHYYENIISSMPGNVYWLDESLKAAGCNQNVLDMFGLDDINKFKGLSFEEMGKIGGWTEIATQSFRQDSLDVLLSGTPKLNIEEPPIPHSNGKLIYFLTHRVPILNEDKKAIGIVGISVDITERKQMEQALRQSKIDAESARERAEAATYIMTEFVSNMGHMLVTPFSTISGMATMLMYGYGDKYLELKPLLEELLKGCAAWEKVYQEIIRSTSISEIEVKPEPFSINQELENIASILKPSAAAKGLDLEVKPFESEKGDVIETDKLKFHLILVELVSNAIKFTAQGSVLVSVTRTDDAYLIEVSDTGIGIPSDKVEYIFEQYTMLSRANKYGSNFRGVGAGLFLARQRAKLIDASIQVQSKEGEGSTFVVKIPCKYGKPRH